MTRRWYVVRTEARAEQLAATQLRSDEFEVFSPRVNAVHGQVGPRDTPLFPGYLFLRLDPEEEAWPRFKSSHRVLGLVRFGGELPWLPDGLIEELARRLEEMNQGHGLWRRFRTGDQVRIVSGGIDSLAEVLEEAKSPQAHAKVLFEFMGRIIRAKVPWKDLRPAEDQAWGNHRAPRRTRGRGRWIQGFGPRTAANR